MAYTYILKLSDNSYYVGSCHNLKDRLSKHSQGNVSSTRHKLPLTLVYTKRFKTYSLANTEEHRIKGWKKRKSIENLISYDGDNLINRGPIV